MGSRREGRRSKDAENSDDYPVRRPRRAKRRLIVLLLLLATAIAAAPTIVASTPLRNMLLGKSVPVEGWHIRSERATFAWTGEQTLTGVSIVDSSGQELFSAEAITIDRWLLSLAANQNDLGKLKIVRPLLSVVTRTEGSNLEDFLAAREASSKPKDDATLSTSGPATTVTVEIVEGVVRGFDQPSQQQWLLDQVNFVVDLGGAAAGGFALNGTMNLSSGENGPPGRLKVQFQQIAEQQHQLDLLAQRLPLAPLEPLLSRILPGSRLAGTVASTAQIRWTHDPQGQTLVQTSGSLEASQIEVTADLLSGDRLRCQKLSVPWEINFDGEVIHIGRLKADADWAQFSVNGSLTPDELTSLSMTNLPKREVDISGNVKLDRLAAMLPRALQLREGVQIDSGVLTFQAASNPKSPDAAWTASALIRDVVGSDGRRAIRWEQPIEAHVKLAAAAQGPQVKQFSLHAPFVEADFQKNSDKTTGDFQIDLGQLSQELGQFVDLGAWQFRGTGEGELSLARRAGNQFEASVALQLTQFEVAHNRQTIWAEPQLQVDLQATGQEVDLKPQQLATGTIKLQGPLDAFDLELLAPVDLRAEEKNWQLQIRGNGPLEAWAGRLRPWVEMVPEHIAGEATLNAKIQLANQTIHVLQSEGSITGLRVRDQAMAIDEPKVQFSGDCRWDAQANSLNSRELQLVSSSLTFRSRNIAVELGSSDVPTAQGEVAFNANLERVAAAFAMAGQPESTWLRGLTTGKLKLSSNAERLQADFSTTIDQLQVVRMTSAPVASTERPEIVWAEPQLEAVGKAVYTIATDRLQFEDLKLTGQTVRLSGSATLDKPATEGLLQASGTLEYREETLDQLLASYLGPEVRLQGDRQVRFQVTGQLTDSKTAAEPTHWSRRWTVSTDAGWSTATVYGLPLSAGRVKGSLRDGQIQLLPFDIGVGEGRLTASPKIFLDPPPQQLILPQGPLVSHVQVSPQVSEKMLKYIAPILAGATRAEGEFSVTLNETRIPFDDPKKSRVVGQLEIHQMRVSPGPMIAELVAILEQIDALTKGRPLLQASVTPGSNKAITVENRQIDFQVSEGRVYHRNLEFLIDDVPVRSYGSVGFDQTLALEIEIPIQKKWIDRQRALRSLAGQTIKIPIRGTFSKPRIDERAVAELSRQMLQGVATEAIGSEINRALEKLFKSR